MYSSSLEESATLEDLGFRPREDTRDSICGRMRSWSSLSWMEILFLVLTTLSLLSTFALCIYTLSKIKPDGNIDFVFAIALILNCGFCMYYIFHGVFWERPYEIIVYIVGAIGVCVYLIINFVNTRGWYDNIKITRLVAAGVLAPVTVSIAVILAKTYIDSGVLIFRTVGAREDLQMACRLLFITDALIKFDLQIAGTMLILILNGLDFTLKQILTLAVGFPYTAIWSLCGFLVMRIERNYAIVLFLMSGLLEPTYVIYLIVETARSLLNEKQDTLTTAVFFFGILALSVRLMLLICTGFVMRNFGIGLKQKIAPQFCTREEPAGPLDTRPDMET